MTTEIQLTSLFCQSLEQGSNYRTINLDLDKKIFLNPNAKNYIRLAQGSIPYSFVNISLAEFNNATFTTEFVLLGITYTTTTTLDEGTYPSLTELQNAINFKLKSTSPLDIILTNPGDYIVLDGNTTTSQVILSINTFNLDSAKITFNANLSAELGLSPITYPNLVTGTTASFVSTNPVIYNDFLANGFLVIFTYDSDLQCFSYYQNISYSSILNQFQISNNDILGSMIVLTEQASSLKLPITENKAIQRIKIQIVSPRDFRKQIKFLQGNISLVLTFSVIN